MATAFDEEGGVYDSSFSTYGLGRLLDKPAERDDYLAAINVKVAELFGGGKFCGVYYGSSRSYTRDEINTILKNAGITEFDADSLVNNRLVLSDKYVSSPRHFSGQKHVDTRWYEFVETVHPGGESAYRLSVLRDWGYIFD